MRLTQRRASVSKAAAAALLVFVAGAAIVSSAMTSRSAAPEPPRPRSRTVAAVADTTPPPESPRPRSRTAVAVADTTPPPAPVLAETPDNPTESRNARFRITNSEPGVRFECDFDAGGYKPCRQVLVYSSLDLGDHCLAVRAADSAGNLSTSTRWCWSIVLRGGFPITATLDRPLSPGVTRPLDLVINNPYSFTIRVTNVGITVADPATTDCRESLNLVVTQGLAAPVDVPAKSTMSLSQLDVPEAHWPRLTMPNLSTNQDHCKGARFSLAYTGEAVKP